MTMTNSQRLMQVKKRMEGGELRGSSSSGSAKRYTNSQRLEKLQLENSIGLKSLESDLSAVNDTLNKLYSDWQSPDAMASAKSSVEAMKNRLADYQMYTKKYGSGDTRGIDSVLGSYQAALKDWDNLAGIYGYYKNVDAYNKAKQNAVFDKQFAGLTYDDVQNELGKYGKGSDEYKYLSNYTAYSDLKEFDKAIEALSGKNADLTYQRALEEARNQYALDNAFDLYKDYLEREDFEENSKYVSTIENEKFLWWNQEVAGDPLYEAINSDNSTERSNYLQQYRTMENSFMNMSEPDYVAVIDRLTDEEKGVFNYKYNEESEDAAYDYLEDMEVTLSKRATDGRSEWIKEAVDDSAVASAVLSGLSVPLNIAGGISSGIKNMGDVLTIDKTIGGTASKKKVNPYDTAHAASNLAADIRVEVGENIAESTKGAEVLGQNIPTFLYQTGMSVGDTVLGAAMFGKAFTPIMGSSAYQQTARELMEEGEDNGTIIATSLISGVAEAAFEYIGIDKLFKIRDIDGVKSTIMAALKQAGAEGVEELGTELVNITADTIIRSDGSELVSMYNELIERGYTRTEAGNEIAKQIGSRAGWTFTGGALSGATLGGATSAGLYSDYKASEKAKADRDVTDIASERVLPEKTVSSDNIELRTLAGKMDPEKAEVFVSQYDGKSDLKDYEISFDMAYTYGETGMGAEAALNNRGILTPRQAAEAYKAGIRGASAARRADIEKINARHAASAKGVFDDSVIDYNNTSAEGKINWSTLTTTQKGAITFAKGFSKATGVNIKFIASKTENGKRMGENGSYNPDTNTIEIDVYAGMMDAESVNDSIIPTLSHELTHWMKDKAYDMYDNMREYIVNSFEQSGASVEQLVLKRMELMKKAHLGVKVTEEMAIDEIVARACEDMLSNSDAAREFLAGLSKKDKNALVEKVKEIFNNLKTWVNELLRKYKSNSSEARVLRAYGDKVDELSKMWDETLKKAVKANGRVKENKALAEGIDNIQYSIREEYAGEIEAWAKEGKPDGEVFVLGSTGDVLQGLGAIESDIYMMGDKIKAILKKHPEMTLDEIKKIPQILEKPVLILASRSLDKESQGKRKKLDNTRVVIFGNVKAKNGKPILSVLDLRPIEKKLVVDDMQKVSSAYTKETNPKAFVEKSQIMYADKKITTSLLRTMGFRAPIELNDSGYIGSISYTGQNVKLEGKNFADVVSEGVISNKQYSDRNTEGDLLTEEQKNYFKDSKVRNENGSLKVMYHGTPYGGFTVFKKGLTYFTDSIEYAERYHEPSASSVRGYYEDATNKQTYAVYLNITKPFDVLNNKEDRRIFIEEYVKGGNAMGINPYISNAEIAQHITNGVDWTEADNLKEFFEENDYDYDGIILNEGGDTEYGDRGMSYVTFSPEQIKRIDNLSPTKDADIRYSDREDFDIFMDVFVRPDASKERSNIISEDVTRLKERLSLSKAKVDDNSLRMIAEHLLRNTDSTYDVQNLKNDLAEVYSYITESASVEWEAVMAKCYDVARNVIEKQKKVDIKSNYFKTMLDEVRGVRISLSAEQAEAAVKEYGERYRDRFIGKIIIANDGVSLESQWLEWGVKYPEIFGRDIAPGEQAKALLDIYDILRESAAIYETYTEADMIRSLGTEIYHQYWIRSDYSGTSEIEQQRIKKINFEHRKIMEKLRNNYNADIKEQTYINIIKKLQRQVKKEREEGKLRVTEYRYRIRKNNLIKRITKDALTLNQWLVKNTKEKHVADVMKGPVAHLLSAIDFSSKQLLGMNGSARDYTETKQDISLSAALEKVSKMIVDGVNAEISEDDITELHASLAGLPAGFIERVEELSSKANDVVRKLGDNSYVLNKMDYAELETLEELVTVLKKTVQETNQLYTSSVSGGVPALAQDSMQYMDSMGEKKAKADIFKKLDKLTRWDNSLPYYVFKRFGEGAMKIYESLQNGWDKFAFLIRDVIEFTETVYSTKEVKEWSREVIEFNIDKPRLKVEADNIEVESEKQTVKLTIAQIMSLYCLNKREQARKHILKGGFKAGDIEIGGKSLEQAKGAILNESTLNMMISKLTDRQREVADKLQNYLTNECAKLGNEVTMRRFGIKGFTEKNYFPIKTDASLTKGDAAKDDHPSFFRLLNMPFTKELDKDAKNKIVIEDIFDVFAEHTSNMAKYNALALPVLDACKWFMYKESGAEREGGADDESSVRKSMEVAFGKEAKAYVNTFLKDINGQSNGGRDSITSEFLKKAKLASVSANLRVVALQPTSYLRASAVIDSKYLAKATLHKPQSDKAKKWCGIALWKSLGFYDINVGRGVTELIKHDKSVMDKVTEACLKGAEFADSVTWGYLWNACEAEIKDKRKDLTMGSDEFNKTVGKRLRDVIYATQVVDSTMTRSHLMRGKGGLEQITTAFASEPTLSYNMLQDVCYEWSIIKRQKGATAAYKKCGRKMARVLTAYTVTNLVTALVESGFDAWRDDEEMEPEEFVKVFFANFASNMDVLGKIPYFKEFISLFQGFSANRIEVQWMQYLSYSLKGIIKLFNGEGGSAYTTLKNLLRALSSASGLPFYNVWREFEAVLNRTGALEVEELKEIVDETLGEILPSFKSK